MISYADQINVALKVGKELTRLVYSDHDPFEEAAVPGSSC